jgi:aminomethyltransferase
MAQRTALFDRHRGLGARMVDFAGWEMPVSYRGALEEHRAVRERCGLFDVSHMGEVELRGAGALACADRLTVNAVARLGDDDGQYSIFCDDAGGVVDDLIVYRRSPDRALLVVNAGTTPADLAWISHAPGAEVVDRSADTGLPRSGPRAAAVLVGLASSTRPRCARSPYRTHGRGRADAVSRTGYTGEGQVPELPRRSA